MKLRMDLDGICLQLSIDGYTHTTQQSWDENWCKCSFSFTSGDWLNYHKERDEVLLSSEVDRLADRFEKLLNGELEMPVELSMIEPDFVFRLVPVQDVRNNPDVVYVREGCELVDIQVEWQINFWDDGCFTANYLTVMLDRADIEAMLAYLRLVIGTAAESDPAISKLKEKGLLVE